MYCDAWKLVPDPFPSVTIDLHWPVLPTLSVVYPLKFIYKKTRKSMIFFLISSGCSMWIPRSILCETIFKQCRCRFRFHFCSNINKPLVVQLGFQAAPPLSAHHFYTIHSSLSLESKILEIRWSSWWNSDRFGIQIQRHNATSDYDVIVTFIERFVHLPQVSWTHVLISNSWQAWLGIVDQNWLKLALAKLALGQSISL